MVLFIFVVLIILIAVVIFSGSNDNQIKKAGREGEMRAYSRIKSVLRADDKLYTNVEVSFENKETELDFLIVNKYGVFIIEEKNFNGDLVGKENSLTWRKRKHTDYDTYDKIIDKPTKYSDSNHRNGNRYNHYKQHGRAYNSIESSSKPTDSSSEKRTDIG